MIRKEYRFNHDTLAYEEIKAPFKVRLYHFIRLTIIVFLLMCILSIIFSAMFVTPKLRRMMRERDDLLMKYEILNSRAEVAANNLNELKYRDNNVYRTLFGADTVQIAGIDTPYPPERYAHLEGNEYSDVIVGTWKALDAVARGIYRESLSLDDIQAFARNKEEMALHIPAIWPIDRRDLKSPIGAFNPRRFHPIYKVYRPHNGIDLETDRGKPVYATADGIVKSVNVGLRRSGYGREVLIDHGYGYQTRYAHLNEYIVNAGQSVRRGEQIGAVGNTGGSTGNHLHYEVIYMGKPVDPIMYFRRDMNEDDFRQIIESARETTFETD